MLLFWSLAELLRCGVEGTLMTEIKSVAQKILNENVCKLVCFAPKGFLEN